MPDRAEKGDQAKPTPEEHGRFETLSVHAGGPLGPTTHAVAPPIHRIATRAFDSGPHAADLFDLEVPGHIDSRVIDPMQDVPDRSAASRRASPTTAIRPASSR